jgi:hypothetical protein
MNEQIAEDIFKVISLSSQFEFSLHYGIEYKRCAISLKALGYIYNPHINNAIFEPTDLGREVLLNGGWLAYQKHKAKKEKIENASRKYWWMPNAIALIAIVVSIILALYSRKETSELETKLNKINKELKVKQGQLEKRQLEHEEKASNTLTNKKK